MFVITETKKSTTNSLMFEGKAPDKDKLVLQLRTISNLTGEFCMDEDVRKAIDIWYHKFDKEIAPGIGDETGFVSRILDFVIKIAMILAAGRECSKTIKLEHIKEAMDVVLPLIVPTKRVVNAVKKNDATLVTKRGLILTYILNQPEFKAERSKMLQSLGMQLDHEDLDKVAQHLIQMNVLTIDNHAGVMTYRIRTDRKEVQEWIKQFRS